MPFFKPNIGHGVGGITVEFINGYSNTGNADPWTLTGIDLGASGICVVSAANGNSNTGTTVAIGTGTGTSTPVNADVGAGKGAGITMAYKPGVSGTNTITINWNGINSNGSQAGVAMVRGVSTTTHNHASTSNITNPGTATNMTHAVPTAVSCGISVWGLSVQGRGSPSDVGFTWSQGTELYEGVSGSYSNGSMSWIGSFSGGITETITWGTGTTGTGAMDASEGIISGVIGWSG